MYLRARYYDPESQQFLTVDPALAWTEEAYAYVGGSPTNATDPSGLTVGCAYFENCWHTGDTWGAGFSGSVGCPDGEVDLGTAEGRGMDCVPGEDIEKATEHFALAGTDAAIPGQTTRDKGRGGGKVGFTEPLAEGIEFARKYKYNGKTTVLSSGTKVVRFKYDQARNIALGETGLGPDSCPNVAKFGGWQSNGRISQDGSRGFRVEYDARSGFHINYWVNKTKVHIYVDGTYEEYLQIMKRFNK